MSLQHMRHHPDFESLGHQLRMSLLYYSQSGLNARAHLITVLLSKLSIFIWRRIILTAPRRLGPVIHVHSCQDSDSTSHLANQQPIQFKNKLL